MLFDDDPVAEIENISGIKMDSMPTKPPVKLQTSFSMFDDPTTKNRSNELKPSTNTNSKTNFCRL